MNRRAFLKRLGIGAAATVAAPLVARSQEKEVPKPEISTESMRHDHILLVPPHLESKAREICGWGNLAPGAPLTSEKLRRLRQTFRTLSRT